MELVKPLLAIALVGVAAIGLVLGPAYDILRFISREYVSLTPFVSRLHWLEMRSQVPQPGQARFPHPGEKSGDTSFVGSARAVVFVLMLLVLLISPIVLINALIDRTPEVVFPVLATGFLGFYFFSFAAFLIDARLPAQPSAEKGYVRRTCPRCGTANRMPEDQFDAATCGRCKRVLEANARPELRSAIIAASLIVAVWATGAVAGWNGRTPPAVVMVWSALAAFVCWIYPTTVQIIKRAREKRLMEVGVFADLRLLFVTMAASAMGFVALNQFIVHQSRNPRLLVKHIVDSQHTIDGLINAAKTVDFSFLIAAGVIIAGYFLLKLGGLDWLGRALKARTVFVKAKKIATTAAVCLAAFTVSGAAVGEGVRSNLAGEFAMRLQVKDQVESGEAAVAQAVVAQAVSNALDAAPLPSSACGSGDAGAQACPANLIDALNDTAAKADELQKAWPEANATKIGLPERSPSEVSGQAASTLAAQLAAAGNPDDLRDPSPNPRLYDVEVGGLKPVAEAMKTNNANAKDGWANLVADTLLDRLSAGAALVQTHLAPHAKIELNPFLEQFAGVVPEALKNRVREKLRAVFREVVNACAAAPADCDRIASDEVATAAKDPEVSGMAGAMVTRFQPERLAWAGTLAGVRQANNSSADLLVTAAAPAMETESSGELAGVRRRWEKVAETGPRGRFEYRQQTALEKVAAMLKAWRTHAVFDAVAMRASLKAPTVAEWNNRFMDFLDSDGDYATAFIFMLRHDPVKLDLSADRPDDDLAARYDELSKSVRGKEGNSRDQAVTHTPAFEAATTEVLPPRPPPPRPPPMERPRPVEMHGI
jgi:hypothetical protein